MSESLRPPHWEELVLMQTEINELRAALVERVPLSESLIGEFYMGIAGAQPTLLTRQLFTGIVKAVEQAHNIKGN